MLGADAGTDAGADVGAGAEVLFALRIDQAELLYFDERSVVTRLTRSPAAISVAVARSDSDSVQGVEKATTVTVRCTEVALSLSMEQAQRSAAAIMYQCGGGGSADADAAQRARAPAPVSAPAAASARAGGTSAPARALRLVLESVAVDVQDLCCLTLAGAEVASTPRDDGGATVEAALRTLALRGARSGCDLVGRSPGESEGKGVLPAQLRGSLTLGRDGALVAQSYCVANSTVVLDVTAWRSLSAFAAELSAPLAATSPAASPAVSAIPPTAASVAARTPGSALHVDAVNVTFRLSEACVYFIWIVLFHANLAHNFTRSFP